MFTITEEQITQLRKSGKITEYPNKFPPDLSTIYDNELVLLLGEASRSIGTINNYTRNVPNADYLSYPLVLKEAISSSKIEGTKANVGDIVDVEMGKDLPDEIRDDAKETQRHVAALIYGSQILKAELLYSRTIKDIHEVLLEGVRGNMLRRGEFRQWSNAVSQDQTVGGIVYLPPQPNRIKDLMDRLDKYINEEESVDKLIKAAVIHHEFEAIHPFADGNGRIGRTIVSLFLLKENIIQHPLFFISGYLFRNKEQYYHLLQEINKTQSWDKWIKFFLRAVDFQAKKSCELLDKVSSLVDEYHKKVQGKIKSPYIYHIILCAFKHIVLDSKVIQKEIDGIASKTALENLRRLETIGLLQSANPQSQRNIKFYNKALLDLLAEN